LPTQESTIVSHETQTNLLYLSDHLPSPHSSPIRPHGALRWLTNYSGGALSLKKQTVTDKDMGLISIYISY